MRMAQHRINAELQAEMQRLAAEAALGPIMVLDMNGNVRVVLRHTAFPPLLACHGLQRRWPCRVWT